MFLGDSPYALVISADDVQLHRLCDPLPLREAQKLAPSELQQVFPQDVRAHGFDERVHKEVDGREGEDDKVAYERGSGGAGGLGLN